MVVVEEGEAGAPAFPPSYPPALSPEDCAKSTSKVTLSQPPGAAVWGGLVLLEFEVEGGKVDTFDVQTFDPSLAAWTNFYVGTQAMGQRDDGSYFMAVSPYFSEADKDQEHKLRIRPRQQGCPDADWTETDTFTAGDPLLGTTWKAEIPAALFSGQFMVQRALVVPDDTVNITPELRLGDATISMTFGKKGAFTETISVPLATETDAPFDGCTLAFTFSGTYQLILRQGYGGLMLAISDQTLTSFKGTTCTFPKIADMAFAAVDFKVRINAYTRQGISINYLPTLYATPGAPIWEDNGFGQLFQQLPQFLGYTTAKETGSVSGYVYPQDISFEQQ